MTLNTPTGGLHYDILLDPFEENFDVPPMSI